MSMLWALQAGAGDKDGAAKARKHIMPGIRVKPMPISEPMDVKASLQKLQALDFLAEPKLVGERLQVHFSKNVEQRCIFGSDGGSRPELLASAMQALQSGLESSQEVIAEAVLMPPQRSAPSAPAVTERTEIATPSSKRQRVAETTPEKTVDKLETPKRNEAEFGTLVIFDLLFLDGEPLTGQTLKERREKLRKVFRETSRLRLSTGLVFTASTVTEQLLTAELDRALSAYFLTEGEEKTSYKADGLILKPLTQKYCVEPSESSSLLWLVLQKQTEAALRALRRGPLPNIIGKVKY